MGNDDNSPTRKITGGLLPVDVWKSYMLGAHKGYALNPLSLPDTFNDDPVTESLVVFYEDLTTAFVSERNMASGAKSGGQ